MLNPQITANGSTLSPLLMALAPWVPLLSDITLLITIPSSKKVIFFVFFVFGYNKVVWGKEEEEEGREEREKRRKRRKRVTHNKKK